MSGELKDVAVDLGTRLRKFKEAFAQEMIERIERRTPVDTGALKGGWGKTNKAEGFEIWNTQDYAGYVEYGTEFQRPQAMVRSTLAEGDQIAEVAKNKVGLK